MSYIYFQFYMCSRALLQQDSHFGISISVAQDNWAREVPNPFAQPRRLFPTHPYMRPQKALKGRRFYDLNGWRFANSSTLFAMRCMIILIEWLRMLDGCAVCKRLIGGSRRDMKQAKRPGVSTRMQPQASMDLETALRLQEQSFCCLCAAETSNQQATRIDVQPSAGIKTGRKRQMAGRLDKSMTSCKAKPVCILDGAFVASLFAERPDTINRPRCKGISDQTVDSLSVTVLRSYWPHTRNDKNRIDELCLVAVDHHSVAVALQSLIFAL
ncbi:hypothetical protein BKA67DRAFT_400628 [Truncatella angustata]|uniref:Uncharacterized protein n=1 Tax=Truncatella angustata TaxID=152316 RepID=A0A9P8RQZ3_9PEZI|nr:uncharacterized protein BKA67DRAFT_400628 [Truncatella angustata]KAH6647908.1 hypothetical protein BKA67DRAFT_400628 [Truncatella angustata]